VDHLVLEVLEREEHGGGPDVAFFEEVAFRDPVLARAKHVAADVEFTTQV